MDQAASSKSGRQAGRPVLPTLHYDVRLQRALAFIDAHLAEPISLDQLAACAAFSPFHFHRVFCQWHGETPQAYIRRCRLQRAAALLQYAPGRAIGEIAQQSGFASVEAFNRAFRSYFGVAPGRWRSARWAQVDLPNQPDATVMPGLNDLPVQPEQVQVVHLPCAKVIYQRKIGPYEQGQQAAWQQLRQLTESLNLPAEPLVCFAIGLDDPGLTPAAYCRYDVCIEVPPALPLPLSVPSKILPGGLHAVLPYCGLPFQSRPYWHWLFHVWLAEGRYSVGELPCFERFPGGMPGLAVSQPSQLCLPLVRT
jgi:AraC family transcriptional regulator